MGGLAGDRLGFWFGFDLHDALDWDNTKQSTASGAIYSGSYAGALLLNKASATKTYNGGALIFKLPRVSAFLLTLAQSGSIYYQVETSTDSGANWTVKNAPATALHTAGYYTNDISSFVGTSTTPIWVRITNGATGTLTLHAVKILP